MGKLYTLDDKLLIGTPEVRIKDKLYPVDDREKTVKKVLAIYEDEEKKQDLESIDTVLKMGLGSNFKEISEMNLSWAAYQALMQIVIAAMTGQDPEEIEKRFQEQKSITATK